MPTDIAFALAGLGGFNAHGAGFLTAAKELQVTPDLVTATSGQIIVLAEWLRGSNLETLLIDPHRPAGVLGTLMTAFTGDPGVFRPAFQEYWLRWTRPPTSITDLLAKLFPAEEYKPTRTKEYLDGIADLLNQAPMGVVFNAYNLASGEGVLFGNDRAGALLNGVKIAPITTEAVASALWLSLYGFKGLPNKHMDGAYDRPCIIAELHEFKKIFAVRPLPQGWGNRVPESWFDVQDWQCEMWFSAGYKAEVADMKRINKLIDESSLKDPRYRRIDLIEVSTRHPCGYFNFFTERRWVFREAYEQAKNALKP